MKIEYIFICNTLYYSALVTRNCSNDYKLCVITCINQTLILMIIIITQYLNV